jgi:hypothetical protein
MIDDRLFFSDDRTAIGIKTDHGVYINLSGKRVDQSSLEPKTMRCTKCGKVYHNVTIRTVPHPCECGGVCFETVSEE